MIAANLIYLGPDKAGSTWLATALDEHPDVFVPAAKDLYFFDREYDRGFEWYERHYRNASQPWRADISHDYLYSETAAQRIASHLDTPRLIVCFREPSSRAFSAYLNLRRHGLAPPTFEEALEKVPELIAHGKYRRYVEMYLKYFARADFYFPVFDDLQRDPATFAADLFSWLGLQPVPVPEEARLPAGAPRNERAARLTKMAALRLREAGLAGIVGKVKRAQLVQSLLYRPYGLADRPRADVAVIQQLKLEFVDDVAFVSELIGRDLVAEWDYL